MEFPEHARALALAGADLLLTVAANMEPFLGDHRLASRARALDNRLPHLYCNRCGEEAGVRFVGGSRAIGADGAIHAEAGGAAEELLAVASLPRGLSDQRVDYLAHLREGIGVKSTSTATGGSR
jgi:predicted amidohydrolase